MCGIVGQVGLSKSPEKTYQLLTHLLRETQRRGSHATGFYSIDKFRSTNFYKINKPADFFVRTKNWKENRLRNNYATIGHTRMTTRGSELYEINNHPHISDDKNLAIVHNGMIIEYDSIKHKYPQLNLKGQCDSEIILRMIELKNDPIEGIKELVKAMGWGCMAIEILDNRGESPVFYAFRDTNPMFVADLREELGQFFFCSEYAIWTDAAKSSGLSKKIIECDIASIPTYKIFKIDCKNLEISTVDVEKNDPFDYLNRTIHTSNITPFVPDLSVKTPELSCKKLINEIIEKLEDIQDYIKYEQNSSIEEINLDLEFIKLNVEELEKKFDKNSYHIDENDILESCLD